jgi:hypothetical protein
MGLAGWRLVDMTDGRCISRDAGLQGCLIGALRAQRRERAGRA